MISPKSKKMPHRGITIKFTHSTLTSNEIGSKMRRKLGAVQSTSKRCKLMFSESKILDYKVKQLKGSESLAMYLPEHVMKIPASKKLNP
jgi:hypothetical protein